MVKTEGDDGMDQFLCITVDETEDLDRGVKQRSGYE